MTAKRINRELIFLRAFAFSMAIAIFFLVNSAFKSNGNQKFSEIDVERINIVEKDGTVKMVITNVDRFPYGKTKINDVYTNEKRKKRSGMLFFNEEGLECGGFIYDGKKNEDGHSSGLSFTHDQYDGDQIMQLLSEDYQQGNERFVGSSLTFNDRPKNESQRTKNFGQGTPRIMLGKSRGQRDGLFLFDAKGLPKAMFYVDKENKAKLDFYDDKGNITASFPEDSSR